MPVLFTSMKNYSASKRSFDNAIFKTAGDKADELVHSKNSCTYHDLRIGLYCYCEAMIVDLAIWQNQRINVKKIMSGKDESIFKHFFEHYVFALHTF